MSEEQFEIKDPSEICSDLLSRGIEFDAHDDFWDYQRAANAEILRLQGEGRLHQAEIAHFHNLRFEHCKEVAKLKRQLEDIAEEHESCVKYKKLFNIASRMLKNQQAEIEALESKLADAPTWGDWVDATVENLENAEVGIYEFKATDGSTVIFNNEDNKMTNWCWFNRKSENTHGVMADDYTRFRRLNYTPKPAREVEKKYGDATAKELSMNPHLAKEWSDLAFDLVVLQEKHAAAQAELRELKEKIK